MSLLPPAGVALSYIPEWPLTSSSCFLTHFMVYKTYTKPKLTQTSDTSYQVLGNGKYRQSLTNKVALNSDTSEHNSTHSNLSGFLCLLPQREELRTSNQVEAEGKRATSATHWEVFLISEFCCLFSVCDFNCCRLCRPGHQTVSVSLI